MGSRTLEMSVDPPSATPPTHLGDQDHVQLTRSCYRKYPWSLYAVFQTTVTQWAFPFDAALTAFFYLALREAGYYNTFYEEEASNLQRNRILLWAFFIGHMVFSKTIKLVPHLLRNPGDVRFVPVSIFFGYFHNLIKLYGAITVTEVRTSDSPWT